MRPLIIKQNGYVHTLSNDNHPEALDVVTTLTVTHTCALPCMTQSRDLLQSLARVEKRINQFMYEDTRDKLQELRRMAYSLERPEALFKEIDNIIKSLDDWRN